MEHLKNLNKDLRRQSGLFFQIGLLIAMMLCVSAFEYRAKVEINPVDITNMDIDDEWTPDITYQNPPPPPPKPKMAKPVASNEEVVDEIPKDVVVDPTSIKIPEIEIPEDKPPVESVEEEFIFVESMPEPKEGFSAFYNYINKNLRYPSMARKLDVEGKVFVTALEKETVNDWIILNPNEWISYSPNDRNLHIKKGVKDKILWRKGIFKFDGKTLTQVARELEHWYSVDIKIKNLIYYYLFSSSPYLLI